MSTPLSSRSTFTYKVILPVVVIGSLIFGGTIPLLLGPGSPYVHLNGMSPVGFLLLMLVAAIPAMAVLWVTILPLKKVELADDELLISNYRYEIRVPLSQVKAIDGPSLTNPKTYTIKFESPTEFGDAVMFLPPVPFTMMLFTEPEVIGELRSAVAEAQVARRR